MSSVFISHNHADKPFARRLSGDLAALGARVWLDEAEINIGDSLFDKIEKALDEVDFLAVVLSPNSVASSWVSEELKQALFGHLTGSSRIKVLPLLLKDCTIPGFLREKLYADFRDESRYDDSLSSLASSIGIQMTNPYGAEVRDPFAKKFDRVESFFARPRIWHCIYCGWRCELRYNNYLCLQCKAIRPFFAPGATMLQCKLCKEWSLAFAQYCEWCGEDFKQRIAVR